MSEKFYISDYWLQNGIRKIERKLPESVKTSIDGNFNEEAKGLLETLLEIDINKISEHKHQHPLG